MQNFSNQNNSKDQHPVDAIQQPIFRKLFRDLSVPSEYHDGLSRDLSFLLGTTITDEKQIEQLSKAYILEFLKGIGVNNQKGQSKISTGQTGEGSSKLLKFITGDDNKKAQINLIYQISKAGIFNSYNLLLLAKRNLSNVVKSLADIIKNDDQLLKIYQENKDISDKENPHYNQENLDKISSISAMIANDLSDDFKKNPYSFSHLGINQEQLDEITKLTPQEINIQIHKGIEDKRQAHLANIEKSIEEDLILLFHSDKKNEDAKKNALEKVLDTGKIKFEKEDEQIKVMKINDLEARNQKEIIKNHNDHFIKNIRDNNHKNHQLINEEAIHFDFGSTSHQRALALIASLASNFINRTKTEFKIEILDSFEKPNSVSKSPSQHLNAGQLKPNPRFTEIQ
jgi:hypothetical protein